MTQTEEYAAVALQARDDAELAIRAVETLRLDLDVRLGEMRGELGKTLGATLLEAANKQGGQNTAEIMTRFAEVRTQFVRGADAKVEAIRNEATAILNEFSLSPLAADLKQAQADRLNQIEAEALGRITKAQETSRKDMERRTQDALNKVFEVQAGASKGPVTLLDTFRGPFDPETVYKPGDTFTARGGFYLVIRETKGQLPSSALIRERVYALLAAPGRGGSLGGAQAQPGTGTVSNVSSANANISVANGSSTPVLTLNPVLTGITSINGNTFTAGSYTLTGAASKTLTFSNTLTLAGTDGSALNVGAGGTLGTGAFQPQTVLAGTAGNVTVSNGGVGATTLSLPTALTSINSITSAAGSALVLATGTSGTAITVASATNITTFSANAIVNSKNLGQGAGSSATNTVFGGSSAGASLSTGTDNTFIGQGAGANISNKDSNTALGSNALNAAAGNSNSAFGYASLQSTTGVDNTGFGSQAGRDVTGGGDNTFVGFNTGRGITTGNNNTIIGAGVTGLSSSLSSNIILAIGTGAIKAQYDGTNWALTGCVAVNGATASSSTALITTASTTGVSSMRIPSGTAPTSPVSGDIWYDGTNLKFRDGTTTRTITWT